MTRTSNSKLSARALKSLRRSWGHFGARDPFWAALTTDGKRGRWSAEEFFLSGEQEIASVLERARALGLEAPRRRALDFGCGPGRLTQALALHFEAVDGVDIAPSMIEHARELNRHPDRCRYVLNQADDLRCFADGSFTFIYSVLVLQHMPPELSRGYISEFLRLLAPSGLLVFQVPSHRTESEPPKDAPRTTCDGPLPESALRARVRPRSDSVVGRAGSSLTLQVEVENAGDRNWPALGRPEGTLEIHLGNHWLVDPETVYSWDDGRCPLPFDLAPGQKVVLNLGVRLPEENGEYLLVLDMVQEDRGWFEASGSQTAHVRCRVEAGREPEPDRPLQKKPDQPLQEKKAGQSPSRLPLPVRIGRRLPAARNTLKASGLLKPYWAARRAADWLRVRRDRLLFRWRGHPRRTEPVRGLLKPYRAARRGADWLRVRWDRLHFRRRGHPRRTEPVMEMYCVLRAEVVDLVTERGGRVVDAVGELEPGGFYRYTYWVVKD